MKEQTIKKKKKKKRIIEDCWNLDHAFFEWLQERLPVFLENADKIIDLNYYKIKYKDKTYTQKELIEYLIQLVNKYCSDQFAFTDEKISIVHETVDVWNALILYMWW